MTIEELEVLITASTNDLRKEINKANSIISGLTKSANNAQSSVNSAFKKLKTGIVALGIGKIIKDSIQSGMDAIESDSLFETSLGGFADDVRAWSDKIAEPLGLVATEMRKNTGVIYNMTTSMGLAEENALKMSKGITLLAEDMASFYNLDSAEAFNKLRAGITGETEPLKALGILVDENTIKQVAYSEGIARNGAELTQQQKVLARYVAILKQTGNAQGDLARTINSPSNQLRLLKNQINSLSLSLSAFFIPVISGVLPYITAFTKVVTQGVTALAKLVGLTGSISGTSDAVEIISNSAGGISDGIDNANNSAKKLKGTLSSFDEMNVLTDNSADNSSGNSSGISSAGIDFNLGDYDAHLELLNSKTDTIVENIKKSFGAIKDVIKKVWDSKPVQAFTGAVTNYGKFIFDYWSTIGTNLLNNITITWSKIELNVGTYLTNITTLWTNFWADINGGIQTWGKPIIDGVSNLFNSIWKDIIYPVIQNITKLWADFSGVLVELWSKHGKPLINNIGEFVTNVIALFKKFNDCVLEPIITPFLETLSWLWDKHIKSLIKNTGEFVMSVVNGAIEIYNKFIQPIVSWLFDKLAPVWSYLSSLVCGVMGTIIGVISDVISSFIEIFKGVIDFIVGVFTGNWSKAWNGVKSIFKGIIDGLVGIFKTPINLIIDSINAFLQGLNKIKIPSWVPAVGGKGFNIPTIPKLARGGIVDSPTIAMIGEAGKEAVMPLENNTGWIDKLASKLSDKTNSSGETRVVVKIGEDTIVDRIIDGVNERIFRSNGEVVFSV